MSGNINAMNVKKQRENTRMINEQFLEKIEENRKKMSTIQKLVDDLYWEYNRMSSSGQETLDKLGDFVFKDGEER